eukprot:5313222-Pyramimonas_sp.AAC.1
MVVDDGDDDDGDDDDSEVADHCGGDDNDELEEDMGEVALRPVKASSCGSDPIRAFLETSTGDIQGNSNDG